MNKITKMNSTILNQKDCKGIRALIRSLKEGRDVSGTTASELFKSYRQFLRSMTMQQEATEPSLHNCTNNTCIFEMESDQAIR